MASNEVADWYVRISWLMQLTRLLKGLRATFSRAWLIACSSMSMPMARQGMTLAAMTAGKAVDLLEGGAEDPDGLLAEFSNIDYLSPEKFIFVFLNSDQAATVRKALNVQEDIQIAPALAEYVK